MLPELVSEVPGPRSRELAGRLRTSECRNTTFLADDWPVFWERAAGVNVWDVDGNRFLDLTSAFAVAGLGHGRPELVEALTAQAGTLLHGMGDVHPSRVKVELCEKLGEITFGRWGAGSGKTILSSSGFEAVETALKTAVVATGRRGIVAFEGGYHGLGYGALLGTSMEKFRTPFSSQLAKVATRLPFPRTGRDGDWRAAWHGIAGETIGAVLVEPIQGRAGEVIPPDGFLPFLREWCDAHGALLIFDEIYTGFNRSGLLFACEREQVVPDLICLGKALSGGFPISACVGKAGVMDRWPDSDGEALHTSTFLGHPVGCAMALEAIRLHQSDAVQQEVEDLAVTMKNELLTFRDLTGVSDVRGRGAMWAIEFEEEGLPVRLAVDLLAKGFLVLPGGVHGEVLSLTPPFALAEEELKTAVNALRSLLDA